MDQVIVIILVFIFLIMRAYKKPLKALQKQRQDQKTYPAPSPKREAPGPFHVGVPADKTNQDRQYVPARSSLFRHGEDSIDHDHWEALGVYANYDEGQTIRTNDGDRIQMREGFAHQVSEQYRQDSGLLPEISARGIVKAVIMQEVLGRPKSWRKR